MTTIKRSSSASSSAHRQRAGEAGRSGRADVEAGRDRQFVGAHDVGLGGDDRLPTAGPHRVDVGDPVVRLVVEDAVGERVRIGPRPHHVRPVALGMRSAGEPCPRRRQRRASLGLDRVEPDATARGRLRRTPPARHRRPARTPATARRPAARRAISHPSVRPPSRHSAFSGPCTVNGIAPPATASRKRSIAGSPADRRRAVRTVWIRAPSRSSSSPDVGRSSTSGRTRRSASRRAGPAWRRRSRRCRTTRSRAAPGPGSRPSSSAARRWSRIGTRWRALCDPATLPVSSFTQMSWTSSRRQRIAAAERRDREALGDRMASAPRSRRRTCRWRGRTPTTPAAARSARTGWGRRDRLDGAPVVDEMQHVVRVGRRGVRALPRARAWRCRRTRRTPRSGIR